MSWREDAEINADEKNADTFGDDVFTTWTFDDAVLANAALLPRQTTAAFGNDTANISNEMSVDLFYAPQSPPQH